MSDRKAGDRIYGLVAEFDRPEKLVEAARRAREAGFVRVEACSPFPIEGLSEVIGFDEPWTPLATLLGAIAGVALGYGLQVYAAQDYPIDIGGRPLVAPPAFAIVTFEFLILFGVLGAVVTMLALDRLPRLHHPLFELERFHLASLNRFFLVIEARDPKFHPRRSRAFLEKLDPVRVDEAPFAEAQA